MFLKEKSMKLFISWSGERSKALANKLGDWLPMILQYVEPFVSDQDISAGDRWAQKIAGELENSNFGIICITPENLNSEWILFESGALSKSMNDGKVIPLLFGLEISDLTGPLAQFQAQKADKNGMMEVIRSINKVAKNKTADNIVNKLVPSLWPEFESELKLIKKPSKDNKHNRPQNEILEELVTGVRGITTSLRDINLGGNENMRVPNDPRIMLLNQHQFDLIIKELNKKNTPTPSLLLIMLSVVSRNIFPEAAELITESYRDIKGKSSKEIKEISKNIIEFIDKLISMRSKISNYHFSKNSLIPIRELMFILDMVFSKIINDKLAEEKHLKNLK